MPDDDAPTRLTNTANAAVDGKSVAIVGSRQYPYPDRVKLFVNMLPDGTTVVSGGAHGVDKIAEITANERGLPTKIFPAAWEIFGRRAGYVRNQHIVDAADEVVAFWDGHSRGTLDTIEKAQKAGKPVRVVGLEG